MTRRTALVAVRAVAVAGQIVAIVALVLSKRDLGDLGSLLGDAAVPFIALAACTFVAATTTVVLRHTPEHPTGGPR